MIRNARARIQELEAPHVFKPIGFLGDNLGEINNGFKVFSQLQFMLIFDA